jgi:DnaJ family protein C protein 9
LPILIHTIDKAPESDKTAANKKFQEIAFAYAVLSDERRRKRYDLTGSTAESLEDDEDFNWLDFYREQFENVVTEDSIKKISEEYKGSEQEREDILNAYTKVKGKLDRVYDLVMLSDILEDDERFRKIIDEEIEKGNVESYEAYERENNDEARERSKAAERKRRAAWEKKHGSSKEAADKARSKQKGKGKQTSGNGDLGSLAALIQGRQKARMGGAFFENLEAKYAPQSTARRNNKRATPMDDEPTEEEFQAARKRLQRGTKGGRAAKKKIVQDDDDEDDDEDEDIALDSQEEVSEESEEELTPPPKPKKRGTATKARGRGRGKAKA